MPPNSCDPVTSKELVKEYLGLGLEHLLVDGDDEDDNDRANMANDSEQSMLNRMADRWVKLFGNGVTDESEQSENEKNKEEDAN